MPKIIDWFYPLGVSIALVFLLNYIGFDKTAHNFEKVLDSAVTFSSIVVGFLAALLGILVSIRNTEIVGEIFAQKEHTTLKRYFNETFIIGFSVIMLSNVMYIHINELSKAAEGLFIIWITVSLWFIISTYRIVSILMSVFFKANSSNQRPESNVAEERETIKGRLKKSN